MGIENIPKYLLIAGLMWKIVRPFAVVVAKSTKNTTVDDAMIDAVDQITSSDPGDFDDLPGKGKEVYP